MVGLVVVSGSRVGSVEADDVATVPAVLADGVGVDPSLDSFIKFSICERMVAASSEVACAAGVAGLVAGLFNALEAGALPAAATFSAAFPPATEV